MLVLIFYRKSSLAFLLFPKEGYYIIVWEDQRIFFYFVFILIFLYFLCLFKNVIYNETIPSLVTH